VEYKEPLLRRMEWYFSELASRSNYLGRNAGRYLMYGTFILVAIPIFALAWYAFRRARK
jgi:hypothetical protein